MASKSLVLIVLIALEFIVPIFLLNISYDGSQSLKMTCMLAATCILLYGIVYIPKYVYREFYK